MGYEGHLMREPGDTKADLVERSMGVLLEAAAAVGGDVVSGGGTGTWDTNTWVTELQAGSYCLMDTEYTAPRGGLRERAVREQHGDLRHRRASGACSTPASRPSAWTTATPRVLDVGDCWFVSDEHITFGLAEGATVAVGDRVRVIPAHVDPTVSQHERLHLVDGDEVLEVWDVDLRGW